MGYKAGPLRVKMSWSSITQSAFLILCISSIAVNSQQRDSFSMDILQTIGFPLAEGISFATGIQGPSFRFQGQYIVGRMANTLFPEAFSLYYPDFSIQVTLKPATRHVGPLFAVTDYLQGIIIMGINITEVNSHYNRISLFLTDYKFNDVTQEVAAFIVPALKDKWTQFAFSVKHNTVTFYFNCSGVYDTQVFYKHLGWHLTVPSNGAILVGYLGYAKQPDIRYQGLIQEILITNRASAAEEYCPSFEGSGKDANTADLRDYADDEPRDGAFFGSGEGSGDYIYTDVPDKKGGSGTEELAVTPTQGKEGTLPLGVSDASVAVSPVIRTESVTVGPPIDQFDPNQPAGSSTVELTSQAEVDAPTTPSTTRRATVTPTTSAPLKSTSKPKLPLTPTPPPPPSSPMFTSPIDSTTTKPEKVTTLAPDAPTSSSTFTSAPDVEEGGATSPDVIPSSPVIVPTPTGPDVTGRAETTWDDGRASSPTASVEASSVFTEEGTTVFGPSDDPSFVSSGETDPILTTGITLPDDPSVSPTVPVTSVTASGEPVFVSSGETETFLPRTTLPTEIRTTATRLPPLPPSPTPPYIDTTREVVGGVPGPKGDAGVTGSPGEPGVPGEKGMKGDQGGDGPKGMTGGTGSPGQDGAVGPKGDEGDGGLPGSKGDEGEEGLPGVAGPPGDMGIKGDRGDKGDQGDQGDKGDTGEGFPGPPGPRPTFDPEDLVGPQGTKGEKGDRGKFGPEGPDGARGLPGKRGEQGEQGIKGEKGEPAQVLVGPEGPVGPQGPEGPAGQPGISVFDLGGSGEGLFTGPEGRPGAKGARGVIGPRGMKGQKGVRGSRGPTGLQGVMGIIGPEGPSGRDGANCSCSEGVPGRDGFKGSMGLPGPPGPMGAIGYTGLPGYKGQMGLQGLRGYKGDQGDQGIQGEQGPMGHPGLDGRHGVHGERGLQGPAGPPGPPGPSPTLPPHLFMGGSGGDLVTEDMPVMVEGLPGPPGQDGLPGLDGETGMPGPRGPMGPEGPRGEKGSTGIAGPRGVQGERGVQGPQGDMGPPGFEGMRGFMGLPGADGSPGMHGPRGPKGENGEPGISINGPPGRPGLNGPRGLKGLPGSDGPMGPPGQGGNITVEVLQKLEETFDFVSEAKHLINQTGGIIAGQGQKGVKGDRGLAGTDGLPGLPGPQGVQGVKGDLYVADSSQLIHYKGDRGEQGKRGKRGTKGHFGISGYPGRQGPPGETGPEGPTGPQGPPGEGFAPENFKGDKGEQGPPGPSGVAKSGIGVKGMQGDPGEPGTDGRDGVDGSDGQQGFAGVPGVDGPVGAPGQKGQKGDAAEYLLTKEDFVGTQGLPGPQGPPGESIPGRPGLPGPEGPPGIGKQGEPGPQGPPGLPGPTGSSGDGKQTGGVVKFTSIRHMVRGAASLSPGTFIFIENVQELYLRVDGGMQQVMLGSIFRLEDTPPPPTPPSPPVHPSTGKVTIEEATSGRKVTTVGPGYTHSVPTTEKAKPSVQDTTEAVFIPKITTPAPPTSLATTEVTSQSPTSTAVYSTTQSVRPFEPDLGVDLLPADQPSLYMYALNYPLKGLIEGSESLNGVSGADYECYRQSKEAGLNGTFRAFLSSRVQDVKSIVREEDRMLPIMNYNNEVLYWTWSEVFDNNGLILNDTIHIFSFDGRDIMVDSRWPEKLVWHGSYSDGTRMPNSYCDEWRTRNKRASGQASNLHQHQLLGQKKHKCKKPLAVLCIQAARLTV